MGGIVRRIKARPVARSEGLLVELVGDETVVYDTKSKEAHCLNPLASAVYAHADGRASVDELAATASAHLGEPVDASRVFDALAQLEERDLMVAPLGRRDGLSRRDLMRRSAAVGAAAVAAPLITTIVAPTPAAAQTPGCGEILCCPCRTGGGGQDCCEHPSAGACNCVKAEGNCGKQCKSTGAAVGEEDCKVLFPPDGIPDPPVPCPCTTAVC
jgi:hypothetical protein